MSKSKKRSSPPDPQNAALPPSKKRNFSSYYRHLIAVGLIAGVAFFIYSNTFSVPFHFDDRPNITLNPNVQIKVFTWDRIEHLIKYSYRESIRVFAYFTFALNYYFGEFDVFGYHLVNFIIHVFSGIFLYWFLYLTFNLPSLRDKYGAVSYKAALFASLIFISHPIQTQSVTYIVQRMASMAGMFYLLTFVLYIQGRLSKGRTRFFCFGGGVVTYLLGVFTKENAAILPFFIALYEFYFFQHLDLSPKGKKIVGVLIGVLLFLGALGFLIWGPRYIQETIAGYQTRSFTMGERVLTQFRIVLYYLSLLLYPHPARLNLDYDFPVSKSILDPATTLLSMVVVLGLIGYSLWIARKRPVLSFCILWYFGNLVIESSIFPLEMVFEHRLYLPSIGPFILFALLVVKGIEEGKVRWATKRVLK
jgi:protein O-mannosyl-transferase